jgi:hypothetical protein
LEEVNVQKDTGDGKDVIVVKKLDSSSLFSKQEIREFVREFVASWIRGDIIIRFPTAAELAKKTPWSIAFPVDPSVDAELKIKEHYIDLLSVCAGTKQASAEERERAVTEVFKMLLMFRSANRVEGRIMSNDLDRRMKELEKTLNSTSKLVEQITGFLFAKTKKPTVAKKREG